MDNISKILSIAGSDSCGGAGIQADIKTATSLGCHCCTVLTVVTAQNTAEIKSIIELSEEFIIKELDCVFSDIEIDVVKLGVLYSEKITSLICNYIKKINEQRKKENKTDLIVVFDPVFIAGSGAMLIEKIEYAKTLLNTICPICTIITPNAYECKLILEALQCDVNFEKINPIEACKLIITKLNINACFLKSCNIGLGTDEENKQFAVDCLCIRKEKEKTKNSNISIKDSYVYDVYKLKTKKLPSENVHGTGCTLSTSLACFLSKKYDLVQSCVESKKYVYHCIKNGYELGKRSLGLNNLEGAKKLITTNDIDIIKVASDI